MRGFPFEKKKYKRNCVLIQSRIRFRFLLFFHLTLHASAQGSVNSFTRSHTRRTHHLPKAVEKSWYLSRPLYRKGRWNGHGTELEDWSSTSLHLSQQVRRVIFLTSKGKEMQLWGQYFFSDRDDVCTLTKEKRRKEQNLFEWYTMCLISRARAPL